MSDFFQKEFDDNLQVYFKRTRNDLFEATNKNLSNFDFRNFSYYVKIFFSNFQARLQGIKLDYVGNAFLVLTMLLMMIIVPKINKAEVSFFSLLL